jgi:enamine deaminase RidA (YjgF/YER057c/UK114 family)
MIERHGTGKYFHRAVAANGVLYLSGMTATDTTAGMQGQTKQILDKMAALLTELGSSTSNVLSATIYITDMSIKEQMNQAWVEFFRPEDLPARATLGVKDLGPGILIEVMVTAAAG